MRKKWTSEDNNFLRENYHRLSYEKIVERLGRSGGAIRQQAYKLGLSKFPDDISFFENWSSDSAYVVGFWAADGYANVREGKGIALSITQKSRDILEQIQKLLGTGNLYYIHQYDSYRLEWHSRNGYKWLNSIFGHNVEHKSRTMQWPNIPNGYVRDFIRGYFDGDGHISIDGRGTPQMRFYCGSEEFRARLMDKISQCTGIEGTTSTAINDVYLALYIGVKAICLAKWLYSDCKTIVLKRKKEVADEMMSLRKRYNRASVTPKMRASFPSILDRKAYE